MQLSKTIYNPFIRRNDTTSKVMSEVVLALIPSIVMAWVAYGFAPVIVILVAVGSAMLGEFLFSWIFLKNTYSVGDGSAIVTGILLAFTVGPFTPLYVVAFGGATATIFGKMLWGGLGRNVFNPALVGREFMTIFFPAIMSSGVIWQDKSLIRVEHITITGHEFYDEFFYHVAGAIGEYSPFFLVLGGLFLLYRNRISWHTPFAMLTTFAILLFVFQGNVLQFSFGGLFLGSIFMATDMPTSSCTNTGKIYFGAMVGLICILCLRNGVSNGYFSFAILIMNGFVMPINRIFRTRIWAEKINWWDRVWKGLVLTAVIIGLTYLVILLDNNDAIMYPVLFFIVYTIARYIVKDMKKKENKKNVPHAG